MKEANQSIQAQLDRMCESGKLFKSNVTGDQLWTLYMQGFGNDPVFRDPDSSVHNCNLCKNFIRRYGNVISLDKDYNIVTLFDGAVDEEFRESFRLMSEALKRAPIANVFFETYLELNSLPYERCTMQQSKYKLGIDSNMKMYNAEEARKFGVVKEGEVRRFTHLHVMLPAMYVDKSGSSIESVCANYRSSKEVFKRGLDEIAIDTLELVRDLITQGSLLNGESYLSKLTAFISFAIDYTHVPVDKRDNWCWTKSHGLSIARFRNELIGTLCVELSEGKELNAACLDWNKRADPVNYMKAKAPITQNQINEAQKFVQENGYEASFNRSLATLRDIKASEILHLNAGTGEMKNVSIFDNVKATSTRHKRSEFDGIEEVTIDKFMKDILPTCTSVELYLENRLEKNIVTLTTAKDPESKRIFKWDNNYSWTYEGNLAGKSEIKESVKLRGGETEGPLRFSISWAGPGSDDNTDLDAWATEPGGVSIGYSSMYRRDKEHRSPCSGQLDVDIIRPADYHGKDIVENIVWTDKNKMKNGPYRLWIDTYANRRLKGAKAEVEIEGEIYTYEKKGSFPKLEVAVVTLKDGQFTIEHKAPLVESALQPKEIYGLESLKFHKVNLVCLSPNYWGENKTGNKHYFFMLEGCKVDKPIRGFHNENLNGDLLEHRKVMEVLGLSAMIQPVDDQLSGVGFNATVRDEVILKLGGSFKRVVKVKF